MASYNYNIIDSPAIRQLPYFGGTSYKKLHFNFSLGMDDTIKYNIKYKHKQYASSADNTFDN